MKGRAPFRSILDPAFLYTPSHATDVRKTFARVRHASAAASPPARTAVQVIQLASPARRVRALLEAKP